MIHVQRAMGVDEDAILATSCGTRRQVIASIDIPSAESCQMSDLERTVMGALVPGVGGMVVLRSQVGTTTGVLPSVSVVGRWKYLWMGQLTEVDVCPWAAFGFPCAIQRKQDRGQSQPWPL